ncbi:hypothetical protein ATCC90586_002052 [Pythium insidiosum]|nr:hypothetical protein ATCC90586_002052 [Pythium insidiosum]
MQRNLASAESFVCDSGSKRLSIDRLNDNYCDCDDGSDEPGTAACSHTAARFHCANTGYFATNIPTSRVNDQICDCCDGSDEYASGVTCEKTCVSLMETFMAERRELLEAFERGQAARQELVEAARAKLTADRASVETLGREIDALRSSKAATEKLKEREELEETKERFENAKAVKREMLVKLGLHELTHEQLGFIVLELANSMYSKDDLLRFVRAERDAVATPLPESPLEKEEAEWKIRDKEREEESKRIETLREERRKRKEEQEKARSEAIEKGETPPEVVDEDATDPLVTPTVEERPVKKMFEQMSTFSAYERPQAKEAREKLQLTASDLSTKENELRTLQSALEKEYGADQILYALRDQCVETQGGQYTYKMCFYGSAKQDHTSLGSMDAYDPNKPNEISFSGGQSCWNGPSRSLKVTMECGADVELFEVDEPSTCVYTAKLKTPVVCDEAHKAQLVSTDGEASSATPHHIEVAVDAA